MMSNISEILDSKGHDIYSISPEASVHEAVVEMCRVRVGALLVVDDEGTAVGIVSERDLMLRVLLKHLDPTKTPVSEIMTRKVVCIDVNRTIRGAMALMTYARCRHLPVVQRGRVIGLVSIGDLARVISADQEYELRMLHEYVEGRYPG